MQPSTSSAKSIICLATLLLSTLVLAFGQQAAPPKKDEGAAPNESRKGSTVSGRIIYEDTRRPLRRVQVVIYDPASKEQRRHLMAWTDGRGEFRIKNVPAGKYFVAVNAPGIIRAGPLDAEDSQRDLTSVTADGSSQSEIVVRVKRGGAISGKVLYADGDPAINTPIKVLRKKEGKWEPVYTGGFSTERAVTDERGVYRVSGLSPGEYLVGASEEKMAIEVTARDDPDGGNLLNRAVISTTYYDRATNLSGATVLRVEAGGEAADINITLADRPVHSLSGVIIFKGNSRPIARARVSLKRRDEETALRSELEEPVTNTDEQGRFTFDEVQDGSYTLTITPVRVFARSYDDIPTASQASVTAGQNFASKQMEVNVTGVDLTNLVVEVSSGGRISGTVAIEGNKPLPRTVLIYPEAAAGGRRTDFSTPVRVQADGSFALEGLPSTSVYLRAVVPPENKYYVKSATLGKTDLLREPIEVEEGENVTSVRIVLSPDIGQLSGRVLASGDKSPVPGVSLLFIPADLEQQRFMSKRMFGFTNADGSFRVSGEPGEYLALIMRPGEQPYQLSDAALRVRANSAQRVTLQPGENKLDLTTQSDK